MAGHRVGRGGGGGDGGGVITVEEPGGGGGDGRGGRVVGGVVREDSDCAGFAGANLCLYLAHEEEDGSLLHCD